MWGQAQRDPSRADRPVPCHSGRSGLSLQLTPTQHPPYSTCLTAGPVGAPRWCPRPHRRVFGAAGSSKSLLVTVPPPQRPTAPSVLPSHCSRAAFPASPAPCALAPLPHSVQAAASAACRMSTRTASVFIKHLREKNSCNYRTWEPRGAFALDTLPAWWQLAAVSPALRCGSSHEHFTSAFLGRKGHAVNASRSMDANIICKA